MNNLNDQINYINEMNKINNEVFGEYISKCKRREFISGLLFSVSIGALIGLGIINIFKKSLN